MVFQGDRLKAGNPNKPEEYVIPQKLGIKWIPHKKQRPVPACVLFLISTSNSVAESGLKDAGSLLRVLSCSSRR